MASQLSLLDRKLLDAAAIGMTGDEMEEEFFIPAAQAVARVRQLLGQKNIWDEIEQRKLMAHSLMQRKAEIEKVTIDVENPKHIEAYTKLILAIDRITDKPMKISEDELQRVGQAQAKAMLQMIEMAYGRARALLAEEFPFLDLSDADAKFREGLREAALEIEAA